MTLLYLKRLLLTAVFGCCALPLLFSATITVTSTADSGPGSLREAVSLANSGDEIRFNSATLGGTISLASEIVIDKGLRIRGNGIGNTNIDGGGVARAFNVTTDEYVYIGILKITNCVAAESGGAIANPVGTLRLDGIEISNSRAMGAAADMGGGAVHNAGALQATASRFLDNEATGDSGSGGAILITDGGASITGCTFRNNSSSRAGGAIEDTSGSGLTRLNRCVMTGNSTGPSPGNGGAVHITGGSSMRIIGGTYSNNNAAREGGALWNGAGRMVIKGSKISQNVASGDAADDGGGGIFNNGGLLRIFAGTEITDNVADGASGSGGGVFNSVGGALQMVGATITGNTANRAGGGIEDISGAETVFRVMNSTIDNNVVNDAPGNGGGIHIGSDGSLYLMGGSVSGNQAGAEGGGIWVNSGTMDVGQNTVIDGNTAAGNAADQGGGGLYNSGGGTIIVRNNVVITNNRATGTSGSGGGILNNTGGTLRVDGATISGNEANRAGGGIEDASGAGSMVRIDNTDFIGNRVNTAPGNGGAIHVGSDGDTKIIGGLVRENTAGQEGGGFWNNSGEMQVIRVTFEENVGEGDDADDGGGALFNNGGTMLVSGGTISGNAASGDSGSGGGLLTTGGQVTVQGVTFTENTANRAGGAVEQIDGAFTSINVTYRENEVADSPGNGGAFHVTGGGSTSDFSGGLVVGNTAGSEGGGLWNNGGTMTVTDVTFEDNTASGDGADNGGGALFNNGGTMLVTGGTVAGNAASGDSGSGGGLLTTGGQVTVQGVTFTENKANRAGGAVEQIDGAFTSINVTYRENEVANSPGNGGAFHVTGGGSTSDFSGGLVVGNTAGSEGGGLWNNGGTMTVTDVTFEDNTASGDGGDNGGGALFNNGGTMLVTGGTVAGNAASGDSGSGGGLLTTGGQVTVDNVTFSNNTANRAGGAVEQIDGSFTSVDSDYLDNTVGSAPGNGGAFHVTGRSSTVSFTGGNVLGNSAANEGGGLWNQAGTTMTVTEVAVMDNEVTGAEAGDGGAGIFNSGGVIEIMASTVANNRVGADNGTGGGIFNATGGNVSLMSSTVSGNSAGGNGGGIFSVDTMTVTNSTIARNVGQDGGGILAAGTDAEVTLMGTIVASNRVRAGAGPNLQATGGGTFVSADYNLIGSDFANVFAPEANDIEGASANLAPLADYGGPTMTHRITCLSPAVNAGDPNDNSDDQRGESVFNGRRDIGAFELQRDCPNMFVESQPEALSAPALSAVVRLFPNPTNQPFVNVRLPQATTERVSLSIIDANGRLRGVRHTNGGSVYRLPLEDLPNGTYTVQVVAGEQTTSQRLVIVR